MDAKKKMTKKSPAESPLGRWLRDRGMTQTEFARQWHLATGLTLRLQVLSRWARGDATPIPHHRLLIARVTMGGVPVEAWEGRRAA